MSDTLSTTTGGSEYLQAVQTVIDVRPVPRSDYLRAKSNQLADAVAFAMASGIDGAAYRVPAECADLLAEYATFYDTIRRAILESASSPDAPAGAGLSHPIDEQGAV